jgi:hypothetical protein
LIKIYVTCELGIKYQSIIIEENSVVTSAIENLVTLEDLPEKLAEIAVEYGLENISAIAIVGSKKFTRKIKENVQYYFMSIFNDSPKIELMTK